MKMPCKPSLTFPSSNVVIQEGSHENQRQLVKGLIYLEIPDISFHLNRRTNPREEEEEIHKSQELNLHL